LRNGDAEEHLDLACAVNLGSFIQICRNVFQRGQEHDHGRTKLPDLHHADGAQGLIGVAQPLYVGQVQGGQDGVDNAVIHEHDLPQQSNSNAAAEQGRNVVQSTDEVDAFDVTVEEHRNSQCHNQLARHGVQRVDQGNFQGVPKLSIHGEQLDVVVQAGERGGAGDFVVAERVNQRA